jgi:nucleotide-binding universal stress UspA family protein
MALRDVLALIRPGSEAPGAYGVFLAAACGATLTGACPVVEPSLPPHVLAELPRELLERMHSEAVEAAEKMLEAFKAAATARSVAVETLAFETDEIALDAEVSRLTRLYDLAIVEQSNPDGVDTTRTIEAALFRSGRPVLIVPYIPSRAELKSAIVAWDGSVTAARAVGDAIPLLRLAERVEVVTVDGGSAEPQRRPADMMARHLKRHGIQADARRLARGGIEVSNAILSHAADVGADLLVMGGYGHSRLREIVLGGTTRDILRSMTLPVLMAH